MKKILIILFAICTVSTTYAHTTVNEKVLKTFNSSFPNAQQPIWSEYAEFYEVYFEEDHIKCRIQYDFDGNVIATRRDYLADKLCPFVKSKIEKKYPGKKIFGITEITSDDTLTYYIIMEDDKSWTDLTVTAQGNVVGTEKLRKAAH